MPVLFRRISLFLDLRPALLSLFGVLGGCCLLSSALGQAAGAPSAEVPLQAMPYSPSLDLSSLDRTVDPCVDFYRFACAGWQRKNPIPSDQASWSVYAKLGTENQQFLWGILEDAAHADPKSRTVVQQKIGDYFAACMDQPAIDRRGLDPLRPELARIASLQDRTALLAELGSIHRRDPGTYFFNSGAEQDQSNSDVMIAEVNAGGLGLPDRDYYVKPDARSQEIRERYQAYIAQMLGMIGEPAAQAQADAATVLRIETALARASLTRVERRDPYKTFHKMTPEQIAALAPAIPWPAYFSAQGIAPVTTLNVAQPEFFKALNTELTSESVDDLRTYLRFHLATAAAPSLSHAFEQANFDFYSKFLRGVPALPPRWKRCTRQVDRYLGEALGQEFVRRTFAAETKAKTQRMTEQIEAAMAQEISGLDWMSPATKAEALRKLHAIRNKIGYPETWRNYSALTIQPGDYFGNVRRSVAFEDARDWAKVGKPVDRNEWGMTPPTVNAYFNPQMGDINFPAGVLQPPLYDPKLDDAPNYGNTGATIGHELTHGFDDEGRQFDAKGNLKDWWTADDAKGFEERIQCVRDQYAGYTVVDDIHINSKLTSGEDVADLGGTLLAYIAWQKEIAGETLADRDGFTPGQRFFVGMAQWACENSRPENLRVNAITDPHSPGAARINGVVVNLPEFARAFRCKAGQPMVKEKVCKVW